MGKGGRKEEKRPQIQAVPVSSVQIPAAVHMVLKYTRSSQTPRESKLQNSCTFSMRYLTVGPNLLLWEVAAAGIKVHRVIWKVANLTFALFQPSLPLAPVSPAQLSSSLWCDHTPFPPLPRCKEENSAWGSPEPLMCSAHHSRLIIYFGLCCWVKSEFVFYGNSGYHSLRGGDGWEHNAQSGWLAETAGQNWKSEDGLH